MKKRQIPLTPSNVYVRIRPETYEGGHTMNGDAVAKQIHGWTDDSVTIGWSCSGKDDMGKALAMGQGQKYGWTKVLQPDATQEEVYTTVASPLVDKLIGDGETAQDVLLFAYGQTGTGKSHTTIGPDGTLNDIPPEGSPHNERWGILPRLAYDIFDRLEKSGRLFSVSFNAVEFYMMTGFDLLMANNPLVVGDDGGPLGLRPIVLQKASDIIAALSLARKNRHTKSTRMNTSSTAASASSPPGSGSDSSSSSATEHSGSSRGHACLILNVFQLDPATKKSVQTKFMLIDMAGAERPDKTGAARLSGQETQTAIEKAYAAMATGKDISLDLPIAATCWLINFELYTIGECVISATDRNKQGGADYKPAVLCNSQAVQIMGACFGGNAAMGVIVTLSQAPQCGWETWFSCRYGESLAKLKSRVKSKSYTKLDTQIKNALAELKAQETALKGTIQKPQIKSKRTAIAMHQRFLLAQLYALVTKYPTQLAGTLSEFDFPPPPTTGYRFPATQFPYPLEGKWDPTSLVSFTMEDGNGSEEFMKLSIKVQRKFVDQMVREQSNNPVNRSWELRCDPPQKVIIDTTAYAPCDNASLLGYVFVPPSSGSAQSSSKKKQRALLIYCHGGGGIYCDAVAYHSHAARYAVENDTVVLNLEYRLAPEYPAPSGAFDAVGAVLFASNGGMEDFGVDPHRIAVAGDSGGAWIAAIAAYELARRGQQDRLRLCLPLCPMVSDILHRTKNKQTPFQVEGGDSTVSMWSWTERNLCGNKPWPASSPKAWLWPSSMDKETALKFPPVAIITSEYDLCRRQAEDFASKLQQLGGEEKVVEFLVHPGGSHGWWAVMDHPQSAMYWADFTTIWNRFMM